MSEKVEQVLQKIHFIERDIELHKNILMTIPEDQQEELEKVIREIVRMNERVAELKQSIAELDPVVHAHILKLEEGTRRFQELAATKNFQQVVLREPSIGRPLPNIRAGAQKRTFTADCLLNWKTVPSSPNPSRCSSDRPC